MHESLSVDEAGDPATSAARHPPALTEADTPYFAPWGRKDIRLWCSICGALCVLFGILVVTTSPWFALAYLLVVPYWAEVVFFFRNPRRQIPTAPGLLVSPADGTVWDLDELDENEFVGERCLRIGIFLSVFNVHVNRSPASARVEHLRYQEGKFLDARKPECSTENESNTTGLVIDESGAGNGTKLLMRQVSGAIARNIVVPFEAGATFERGGLVGMIKYGSRTEVWVPLSAGFELEVKLGDKVCGGSSILGRFSGREEDAKGGEEDSPGEPSSEAERD